MLPQPPLPLPPLLLLLLLPPPLGFLAAEFELPVLPPKGLLAAGGLAGAKSARFFPPTFEHSSENLFINSEKLAFEHIPKIGFFESPKVVILGEVIPKANLAKNRASSLTPQTFRTCLILFSSRVSLRPEVKVLTCFVEQ